MRDGYEEWQRLLAHEFLRPHGGPIVLFVDDHELERLRPATADPAGEFVAAVREMVNVPGGSAMFRRVMVALERWTGGEQLDPPPVLPVLAASVLAAARMHSDTRARSTNYYLRLGQVLMPNEDDVAVQALSDELRGDAFLDVVTMWQRLHRWINSRPDVLGTSTIPEDPRPSRIGYPLSQALVRQSDRIALTRFFQTLEITNDSVPTACTLLSTLEIWTASIQNRLSETLMRALRDPEERRLLGEVIQAHAQAWDGRVLTADGNPRIAVRLGLDLERWTARWLFPEPAAAPEMVALPGLPGGEAITLTHAAGREYYDAQGAPPVTAELLAAGFRLRGVDFTAEFSASPVVFLRADQDTDAWSSVPSVVPFEDHVVAVASSHVADIRRLLERAAVDGWRMILQRGGALVPGYALFTEVQFTGGKELNLALAQLPTLGSLGVAPAIVARARLINGLPLARAISKSHFLTGGEPDLLLPMGSEPRMVSVALDGRRTELRANGFSLPLRGLVADQAGSHTVDVDGQRLTFRSLDEEPDPSPPLGTGGIGWTASGKIRTDSCEVTGALVTTPSAVGAVLARRRRDETWLLHRDGRVEQVAEPERPAFLADMGVELRSPMFEIVPPDTACWLAQRRAGRWRLTEIGPSSPREYDVEMNVLDDWRLACADENRARLWNVQLSLAGARA